MYVCMYVYKTGKIFQMTNNCEQLKTDFNVCTHRVYIEWNYNADKFIVKFKFLKFFRHILRIHIFCVCVWNIFGKIV